MRPQCLLFLLPLGAAAVAAPASAPVIQQEVAAAKQLIAAQRGPEARAALAAILAQAPDNPDANCSLGLYACDDGDWTKALVYEAKALAADPNNARYQYGWGAANGVSALKAGIFSKLGYAKKCLAAYRRASELEPKSLQYHWALLSYYQQAPGFAGGDLAQAYLQAGEIRKIDAESGRQAFCQLYVGEKKYDLAFHEYDEALKESPDNFMSLYNFGRLTLATGMRLDEGLGAFRRCLNLPSPPTKGAPTPANLHWRVGSVLEREKQLDAARAEYLAALREQPDFRPASQSLAKLAKGKID